ncbi:hypothetical protein HPP92_021292 [Vanilla planifolia]|uniref:Protein kinase domain-containing protein n=1 Tax=Vanilla planifolia TaxID=51239 RepID=A0A835PYK0_VANPL|nr:hypothetical protein HPP92_021292 [Vanilla planifolia]
MGDLSAEGSALMAFRSAVGRFVLSWNNSVSPCQWLGVTCSGDHVTAVHLPGCGLIGRIPAGILGNLSNLHTLSLRFNALSGPLPNDLFRCFQLRNLYLQGNRFSGVIPASVSSLTNLVRLNLADNNFSGAIPPALNNLTRLGTLYLEGNHLSGEIPQLDLPNLTQFNISYNLLHGSIPAKLRALPVDAFLGMPLCGAPLGPCPGEFSPSPTPVSARGGSKLSGGAIAGIAIGAAIVLLVLLSVMFLLCRRKGNSRAADSANPPELEAALTDKRMTEGVGANRPPAPTDSANPRSSAAASGPRKQLVFISQGAKIFDLEELLRASAEVLGKGTFGTTYKAVLEAGAVVAVKRLRDANVTDKEFKEKVEDIGAMNHTNLVPLRAYYHGKDEKLLVYDYIPMGSLSSLLHGKNRGSGRTPLKWEIRTSIALDAARGIEYIHSTSPTASHGNIKSSNILLATSYEARVSDHGLARLVGAASASNRVAGYRAPEVTDTRKVSQKADVYSFGVLLLELLTERLPLRHSSTRRALICRGGYSRWSGKSGLPRCLTWSF